ncbi:MAG TPA: hypothetical protein PKI01_06845 [Bacteroidales bacterium]|nr:hypothetical protein [Bacteroidales bacterium]
MKKILLLFAFIIFAVGLYAQTPQVFKYQTVVRDAAGAVYANRIVSFRISILRDNPAGTSVYVETHNTTTNDFGIVNLNIGSGSIVSGSFVAIDWGTHEHFVKTEIDMAGGSDYQFMGTSQLLSVPYALFAGKSANAADDFDKDSTNEIQTISEVGNTVTLNKNGGSFTDSDNQILSLNGSLLQISNGNTVQLGGTVDLDWDPLNEIQNLSINGNSVTISQGNTIVLPPQLDPDSTNELQIISKVGSTITLSNGGGSVTDSDNQNLSSTTNGTQRTINISGGSSTNIDIADNDNSNINELQILSYSNDTLSLSQGNYVVLPKNYDNDSTNEIQSLSINYKTLKISSADSVIINYGPTFIRTLLTTISTNGWNTIDISPYVPVNASAIILEVQFSGWNGLTCRKNSSSINTAHIYASNGIYQMTVPIDNNRTFQASIDNTSTSVIIFLNAYY